MVGVPGRYGLAVPIASLEIPGSVHGVLAARIDSLSKAEKTILLRASVIGPRIDVGLLRDLCHMPREELLVHLTRLQNAGFLERTRILPNLEYSFRHALIHDVAYGTLLKRRRREFHELAMAAIERRRSTQPPNKVELLAYHAFHAENWPKALIYCRRAGLRAQSKSANLEAVGFFEQALQAAAENPHTPRYQCREVDIRLELVQSLFPLGRHDQVHRHLLAAQKLASVMHEERLLANVASALVVYYWVTSSLDRASRTGKKALAMAEKLNDLKCEIQLATRLGGVDLYRGNYKPACRLLEATIRKIPSSASHNRFGLFVVASECNRAYLACALGELGQFDEAAKVGDEGIQNAEEAGHVFSQIHAYLFVSHALLKKGDFERSLPTLLRSYDLCKSTRATLLFPVSAASLGYAYVRLGNLSEGLDLLQRAAASAEQLAIRCELSQEMIWLGEAHLLTKDYDQALVCAEKALKFAEKLGAKGHEAWALWLLGQIFGQQESKPNRQAEAYLLKAQKIAFARHMRPLLAHTDLELGKLYSGQEVWVEANLRIESAVSTYRSLGMTYWLKGANAALADISQHAPDRIAVR